MTHSAPRTAHSTDSWRSHILKEFIPNVARLTLVADPDGLLLEEGILEGIRERGFELIPFEDHIAFRYAYESKFRSRWDRGEQTDLVVVLRSAVGDLGGLPYDLLQAGRRLSFNLGDIFPNLSYPVVAALDRGCLDALYDAQKTHVPGNLGENATKEFILRHVFEIAPELIKKPSDLLHVLLRRHYRNQQIPNALDKRLIQLLRHNLIFKDWPLDKLVSDREAFFAFLQERWLIFLDHEAAKQIPGFHDSARPYGLTIEGPVDLPFDHDDIRIYIDNLFVEGILKPVSHEYADSLAKTWAGIGILRNLVENRSRRLDKLIESLKASIPANDAKHTEWCHFAYRWAELIFLLNEQSDDAADGMHEQAQRLQSQVDDVFTAWLQKRFAGLINLPPVPPVMLHHLPRFLARQIEDNRSAKIALVVVDGLAIDQWLAIRSALTARQSNILFREQALFSWIPSLTSVSRQAAFAGKAPIFFPNSIWTTDKEPALWQQFWADQGYTPNEIIYKKGLGNGDLADVAEMLSHPKPKIVGLIVDMVDKIMHGMEMGTAGMHSQVAQWAKQPYLHSLLGLLLDRGYQVYLTSDHGNIEAEGCGSPSEGAVADLRGERVRIYPDGILRRQVKERFPESREWGSVGLPEDYLPLLAPARKAFIQEHKRSVCHGGISIEEIIVPLVQIERKS
jgi:hypothetical protein